VAIPTERARGHGEAALLPSAPSIQKTGSPWRLPRLLDCPGLRRESLTRTHGSREPCHSLPCLGTEAFSLDQKAPRCTRSSRHPNLPAGRSESRGSPSQCIDRGRMQAHRFWAKRQAERLTGADSRSNPPGVRSRFSRRTAPDRSAAMPSSIHRSCLTAPSRSARVAPTHLRLAGHMPQVNPL